MKKKKLTFDFGEKKDSPENEKSVPDKINKLLTI